MKKKTTYFKIISHFGKQRDDYSHVIMVVESSSNLDEWKKIYSSSKYDEVINWLSHIILVNKLNNYHIIADFRVCSDILSKIAINEDNNLKIPTEYGVNKSQNKKYIAKLSINNDRIIEVEGLQGPFSCEVIGCVPFISENEETDKQDCYGECLQDDQELTKDLMLDEVISSQHREIERLMNIVQDLVTTNLKLVEIMGLKK